MIFDAGELLPTALRLAVALLLGSAIGFERQWHQKMAGLRTNALVALGACGFVVFSGLVGQGDPTRVAAQVVTRHRLPGCRRHPARGRQRARAEHRGDAVVLGHGRHDWPAPACWVRACWPRGS